MIHGELVVDNFAGGGGTSIGIKSVIGCSVDIAINHDPMAIAQHMANHPDTKHYCTSVWDVDPIEACNGFPVAIAWFSPDCTHFSKAKGKKPKDKNIRGLAWVALRWAALVRPRVIMLENVEEFQSWGPLNRNHHPIHAKKGVTFQKFLNQLMDLGYEIEFRELVAADYGVPTMRKRFFLIARCDGKQIVWPEPTHGPVDSEKVTAGILKPYIGANAKINFNLPCPSIFDSKEEIERKYGIKAKRPLAEKTMQRIARGIQKFIYENPDPFLVTVNHSGDRAPRNIKDPLPTITGKHGFGIVKPQLVRMKGKIEEEEVNAPIIIQYHSETTRHKFRGQMLDSPLMTVDGSNRYGMVNSILRPFSKRSPLPNVNWKYRSTSIPDYSYAGAGISKGLRSPMMHSHKVWAFLIKYYGTGTGQEIVNPLDTITSHDRFGLVTIEGIDYVIVDIGLRMLEPRELYGCQGFPDDYIIDQDGQGIPYPRTEQVKRCGNAVCPSIPAALVRANLPELCVA